MASNSTNTSACTSAPGDGKFITVFSCDICKERRFSSVEKAEAHERICTGPSGGRNVTTATTPTLTPATMATQNAAAAEQRPAPPRSSAIDLTSPTNSITAASPVTTAATTAPAVAAAANNSSSHATNNNHPPSDGIINKTLFKCRKCKLLFWTTAAAAEHEQGCREAQWYNCAVCQVLRFRTREERTVHEQTCGGPMPLRISDLPLADRIGSSGGGGGGGGGQISSGSVASPARTSGAAQSAPGSSAKRVERSQGSSAAGIPAANDNGGVKQKVGGITGTYIGQQMKESKAATTNSSVASSAQTNSSGGANEGGTPKTANKEETGQTKASEILGNNSKDGPKKDVEWTTVWTCDICHDRQFDCFSDAVEHEKICKGKKEKPQDQPAAKKKDPATNAPQAGKIPSPPKSSQSSAPKPSPSIMPLSPITLFSPVLKDGSDSTNFTQISKYHRLILKSLQLLYPGPSGGPISFKCQHCSHKFCPMNGSTSWTLKEIAQDLPSMVLTHITSACKTFPAQEGTQLPTAKTSGKMPFDDFLALFLSENGIISKPDRGVVLLSDEEFRKFPGSEKSKRGKLIGVKKKRGRPEAKSTAVKRKKATKPTEKPIRSKHDAIKYGDMGCRMHNEEGAQFCLGPLDGLPFLSSLSREESKNLRPSEKFVLQQLELFTLSPDLVKSANINGPPQCVGVRCRNCIADKNGCCFMKLSSVKNLHADVMLMVSEHITNCRFMKAKDLKVVQEFLALDVEQSLLRKYCNWIAKLYCLRNSLNTTGKLGVVWGDSPKVTKEYSCPADAVVALVKSMPDLEAETPTPSQV